MHRGIFPMEPPVSCRHIRPLLLQILHEASQGLHNVGCVDCNTPRNNIGVDQALRVEEGQDHLLGPAGLDLGLDGPWLPLEDPLFGLLFSQRGVVGYQGLIHGHNSVQHRQRPAANGGDEISADPDPLQHLFSGQKLRYPSGRLLNQAQIVMNDVENGSI